MDDPCKLIEAVIQAKLHGVTPEDLHAFFPFVKHLEMTNPDTVQGGTIDIPEEYEEEDGTDREVARRRRIGF